MRADLPRYIRITDIDEHGRFAPEPPVSVDSPVSGNYLLAPGDIVVARTGASVGKSYRYDPSDGPLVFAGFLMAISPDPVVLNPRYLAYCLQSKPFWDWIQSESVRSGQPGINAQQLARFPIAAPSVGVQRAVVARLCDVDELICALESVISKKRDIRQGMMQELLTGHARLPGFGTEWTQSSLGAVARVVGGGTPSTRVAAYWGGDIPWFAPAEIDAGGSGLVARSERTITSEGLANSAATLLPAGTVLVTSRASIGNCAVAAVPVATNQGFTSLVPQSPKSTRFLYYWIQQNKSELVSRAAGSTFLEISARRVAAIPLRAPSLDEQDAIGSALHDVDRELGALVRRLETARNVKQGMMQELLTGRTRLGVEGDAA